MDYKGKGKRKMYQKGRAWIELNMDNLIHNVSQFRRLLPSDCAIMPAIKANAYGHGADIIGLALLVTSSSCDFLDEEAYEFITPDNFYKTEADANAALTAIYNRFNETNGYKRYIWMGADFPGEAAYANASAPSRVEMDNLTWTVTTVFCKNIW